MLNRITAMGRLTRDPELRKTNSGLSCANFSLAVERDIADSQTGKRETDFIDCVAWRATADFVSKYFQKGSMAVVSGRLQIRTWQDKNGNNRRTAEIVTDNIYFGSSKKDSQGSAASDYSPPVSDPMAEYPELTGEDEGFPF